MEPPFSRIGNVTIEKVSSDPKKNEDTKMNFSSDSSESDHLFSEDDHLDDKIPSQSPLDQSLSSTKRKNEFENLENIKKSKTSDNVAVSNELLTSEINFENLDNKSLDPVLRTNISDNEDTEYDSEDESDPEEPDPTSKLQAPKAVISTDNTDFIEKLSELGEPSKPDDTKIDSSDYDYDITEKLKEMGEISVQTVKKGEKPKKTEAEETENEISVMPAKKDPGSDSDDKLSSEKKIGNMRRNIREVMDETQLDEATLAAQRQEMERLRRVQEQQRIIREVQRQIALNRQNTKTQHRVISLLQGNSSLIKSFPGSSREGVASGSGGPSASGSSQGGPPPGKIGGTVLVKLPNGETKSMTRITKSGAPFDIVRLQKGALQGKVPRNLIPLKKGAGGNLTPSVSIAPVSKRIEPKIEPESDSESDFSDSEKKVRKVADVVTISSSSDDDCIVLSEDEPEEPEPDEDPCNSGMHTNDAYNVPDEQGRVLINVGHPENEAEIFLAPQIARVIKPHQIGGVRFLYDNVIESIDRFSTSTGFGCILAHSMGLGKTLQIVCFSDIFLRHTGAKTILCIMPINTLQNWMAEFNMWLPKDTANSPLLSHGEVRPRNFNIFVLNDSHKTLAARAKVIQEWHKDGGVLLIGYELYRLLSLRRNPKPKKKKKPIGSNPDRPETPEDEEKNKSLFEEIHEALVKPGPDLVICDEGHRIKNSHASISQALKQIRSKRRIVLTGYPLQNNLLEYWCMVDFVRPNYLGTKTEFSNMFERPIQNGQCIDSTPQDIRLMRYRAHVLHSLLEGFVQRRSHAVLQTSLPQKEEYVLLVRMTEFQRKLYDTFMNDVVRTKTVPNPLKAFAVCCKIWNHPDVLYHFLKKQTVGEAVDLDLEEVAGTVPGAATPTQTTPKKGSSRSKGGTKKEKKAAASKNAQKPAASVTPNTSATTTVSNTSSSTTTNTTTPNIQNIPAPTTFPAPQPIPQPNMSTSIPQNQNQNQMPQNVQNPQQNYQNMNQNYPNAPYPYPQQNYNYQQQNGDFYQNQGQQNYQNYYPNNYPNQEYNNFYPENKPEGYNMQQYQQPNDQQNYWQNNQQQQNQFYQHNGPQPQNDYYQQQNYQPQQQNQDYYRQNQYNQNNYQNFPQNNPYQQNQGWNPSEVKPEFPQNVEFSQDKDSKLENMDKKLHDLELGDEKMDEEKKDFDFKDDEEKEREVDIKNAEMMAAALIKKEDPGIPYDWAQELMKGYLPGCIENSAKMEIFFCILQESIALGDRILLFSQSLFTLNLIEEYLQCREVPGTTDKWAKGKQYYRLDGSTSALEREKLINEYNSNPNIHLFLVSTRAGSLGINLVGANRVIVFDASWNPCHDTQAVCRVYRYGQKKPCFVYRIVMDNCLEKKIYDRQINKQGMADRVVDECNPDAHLSMKDVTNLCWDDEKDSEVKDFSTTKDKYIDVVMQKVLDAYSSRLSKEPFQHESLLIDRKEKKLSQAEKRLAKRSYELEKQANINSRPTYSYYNSGSGQGLQIRAIRSADGSILQSKPVASVRPMQSENMTRDLGRPGGASGTGRSRWIPAEVWQRQGMTAQEMTLPLDVVIPTNSPDRGSIVLKAGQKVLVLKSPKGIYMQLECGKIVAIKTAFKVRGGKAPDKDNDGSKEPGAPTTILKKVPHANTSKSGGNVPLPLKNNTAITVIPKGGQQRLVKPFTHGGMKLNMRSIRQPVPNLVGRQVPMRLGGPRFTGKIQSIHRKVQLARAKPYNMDKNTFDPSKIKSEPQEPAEPEPHVVPSSDEEIHQESHKENLDKRSGSFENSECADLENYQSGETFSESEKSVENSDDFMGKDRRHSTESEKISNDSFAMDYQKIPHMSGGENKFPNPIEQSEPFIQHNMPHNPLNLPHNSSHMPTNPLNMPMNSPNMQHIPNMSHNPSNMPHNPPNMHNPLNIPHNPPNMSHNPSNMPHNPQNMQQNPQNLPQNPPNMPQNPQNIPHNPPNMHNPPNIPHNPPNISHNPPNMPHNPSNMPHNPSNMPLNPPNIPHNPPNIPHNPPNLVPYSTVQPYPQNFDAYNMVDKVKPVLPTENVGEKSLPVPPLVETKKSTIQVQNMPQPISTAIVQESTNSRSLKNYRHNFAGQKTSKKPVATSSALHQLEQTTSAIGESKQPFQESLNNITNSYEAKNDENIIDLDDKPDDATDKNKSSGNKHSSPSLLKHFTPNPSNIQQNNSKTDIPHTVVPQHLNQPNPVPQTPHSLPGPPSQHPPPLVIPSQPPQALNQPPNPTNTQNAPPTQNQNPTEYPPNMGAYGGYYGYGPPNMGPPVQPYPPPPQGYYPNPDMSQFGERNKDKDKSTTGPAAAQNVSGPPRPDASQSTPDPPPVQTTPPAQTTPAISPTTPPVAPSPSANPPTPAGPPSSSNQPMTPNTTTASATPSAGTQPYGAPAGAPGAPAAPPAGGFPPYGQPGMPPPPHGGYDMMYGQQNQYGGNYPGLPYPNQPNYQPPYQNYDQNYPPATPGAPNMYSAFHRPEVPHYSDPYQYGRNYPPQYSYPPAGAPPANYPAAGYEYNYNAGGFAPPPPPFVAPPYNGMPNNNAVP